MKSVSSILTARRNELGFGLRRLCERSFQLKYITSPISPAYYSRLERGVDVDPEKLSLEKCWTLGVTMRIDPLYLFVLSRPSINQKYLNAEERAELFPLQSIAPPVNFSSFIHNRRLDMGFGLRELAEKVTSCPEAVFSLSAGFLSQIESNFRGLSSVVSGEKLWGIGVLLGVDPLLLYVMSRNLDTDLLDAKKRSNLFV